MGDIGCAVFIVEATNPKNLDLNKNLNLIIIENKLGLSWAKLSQGWGYSFVEVKISQELMYKCVFDSYLWVASNFCVRSNAELSISVELKLVEVNHSYFKTIFFHPTIIISCVLSLFDNSCS